MSESLLKRLEETVSGGTSERREQALWHATDLLIAGRYSDDQIWMFGEMIERLASELEVEARAQLANRLAPVDHAPAQVLNKLALDDSIEVAGPVLRQSQKLDVRTLVTAASSKSQQHLLAISQRTSVCEEVTDVLVKRGDSTVLKSVAANPGARLSGPSLLSMIRRSEGDTILAENLGQRRDIPRHLFQQLIAKASEDVKRRLASERPELAGQIGSSVADVTGKMQSKFGPASKEYFAAKKAVQAQRLAGKLNEKLVLEYATARSFEEAGVALSMLCGLPVNVVERAMNDKNGELLLIVVRALRFSWETAMSLLFLGAPEHRISAQHLDSLGKAFSNLNVETSRGVLKLYQSRQHEAEAGSDMNRLPQLHERRG